MDASDCCIGGRAPVNGRNDKNVSREFGGPFAAEAGGSGIFARGAWRLFEEAGGIGLGHGKAAGLHSTCFICGTGGGGWFPNMKKRFNPWWGSRAGEAARGRGEAMPRLLLNIIGPAERSGPTDNNPPRWTPYWDTRNGEENVFKGGLLERSFLGLAEAGKEKCCRQGPGTRELESTERAAGSSVFGKRVMR